MGLEGREEWAEWWIAVIILRRVIGVVTWWMASNDGLLRECWGHQDC